MNDQEARKLVEAVEESLERLDALGETERAAAHQAITRLCELYGEALRRLIAEGERRDDASWLPRFARTDELLAHLLLLHGLHPDGEQPLEKLLAEDAAVATAAAAERGRRGRELPGLARRVERDAVPEGPEGFLRSRVSGDSAGAGEPARDAARRRGASGLGAEAGERRQVVFFLGRVPPLSMRRRATARRQGAAGP